MGLWDRLHKDETLTPSVADAIATSDAVREHREVWGRPGRCPQCGGIGYLDRVDLIERLQYEHCVECFHKWTVTEAETVHA